MVISVKIYIDLSAIENTLIQLNKTISEYEQLDKTIFRTLNDSSTFWNDGIANSFFIEVEKQSKSNDKVINNLKDNTDLLNYMINSYLEIGKKIECNLNSESDINKKINDILERLYNIIILYSNLNMYFSSYERNILLNEKVKLTSVYNNLKIMLNNINSKFEKMRKIEKNIKIKIEKLNNYTIDIFDSNIFIKE